MAEFFWFDGQAPQGPFKIAELLKKPGFGPESIVCPVGADKPEDWKPAASYGPLREAFAPPAPPPRRPGLLIAAVIAAVLGAALLGLYLRREQPPRMESPALNLAPPAPPRLAPGSPIGETRP